MPNPLDNPYVKRLVQFFSNPAPEPEPYRPPVMQNDEGIDHKIGDFLDKIGLNGALPFTDPHVNPALRGVEAVRDMATKASPLVNAVQVADGMSGAAMMARGGIKGWHASPHEFTAFDNSKIGTGVGAQMYSHGHYQGGERAVADHFVEQLGGPQLQVGNKMLRTPDVAANKLSADPNNRDLWQGSHDAVEHLLKGQRIDEGLEDYWTFPEPVRQLADILRQAKDDPGGYAAGWAHIAGLMKRGSARVVKVKPHLYETRFNADPATLLNWDKPFAEQTPEVQGAVQNLMPADWKGAPNALGEHIYRNISSRAGGDPQASQALLAKGVPGVSYKDYDMSYGLPESPQNHVAFQGSMLDIMKKLFSVAGAAGMGQFLAKQQQQPEQPQQ